MTDLEIIKLCAESMGLHLLPAYPKDHPLYNPNHDRGGLMYSEGNYFIQGGAYNPFRDDEQAMALVKKFKLCTSSHDDDIWLAHFPFGKQANFVGYHTENSNWNRAVCECVAKMQQSLKKAT